MLCKFREFFITHFSVSLSTVLKQSQTKKLRDMNMTSLFDSVQLGDYTLSNRIIMAPLTRGRAVNKGQANSIMADYYAQRASAGLIISEATAVSPQGLGWMNAPGLFTDEQTASWKIVADAVHAKQGRIFLQIWHMGSIVHPDFLNGELPVSSSAVKQQGALKTPKGRDRALVIPQALSKDGIQDVIKDFVSTAKRAISAGLDGVEIHAANGFLIDQFIRDGINQREDEYGGSVENRLRFMLEIVEAVCQAVGSGKVGVRLSPTNKLWGIHDSNPQSTFVKAVERLSDFNLAYIHILEPKPDFGHPIETVDYLTPVLREKYKGSLIINGGYTKELGQQALSNNEAEAIAFGSSFIANPDLVERFKLNAELAEADDCTFYTEGAEGYSDYPKMTTARETEVN